MRLDIAIYEVVFVVCVASVRYCEALLSLAVRPQCPVEGLHGMWRVSLGVAVGSSVGSRTCGYVTRPHMVRSSGPKHGITRYHLISQFCHSDRCPVASQ